MKKARILLVDDDPSILKLLNLRLSAKDFQVETSEDGHSALNKIATFKPQLVITDLRMDGMDGMELFAEIQNLRPGLPVIVLTAHGTIPDAVDATQKGLFAYLTKPFDFAHLYERVNDALRLADGYTQHSDQEQEENGSWRAGIISRSQVMEDLLENTKRVAGSEVNVLIQSPSGTGKEQLAKAIHRASKRKNGPFMAINCAAIPEQLLESELFGHKRGSFTGATKDHVGLFQAAHDGTLFLDEIGDMPLLFQAKLLRVLEEREVRPIGSTESVPVNARVISATHRNLEQAADNGEFRQDLYYRLNVVMLELPPLADRREDIPPLANHFLQQARERNESNVTQFAPDAMEELIKAAWPGNVRQLLNIVEQVVVLSPAPVISAELIRKALRDKPSSLQSYSDAKDQFERNYLLELLRVTEGNVTKAAKIAKRNRTEFYKLLSKHGLEPGLFRSSPED